MAQVDLEIRDIIWTFFIPFAALAAFLIIFITDSVADVRKRFFLWMIKDYAAMHDEATEDIKSALFEDLNEIESKVVDLRNKGVIRILEIGVGTGQNLQYYPQQCRLIVVDPDPSTYFKQYFDEHKNKFPDITLEKFVVSPAEHLKGINSNTVDVCVTTNVLCSVDNIKATLKEIRRVLVPGGRFYFLEHLMDNETASRRRKIQKFLTWSNIWPWLFDGCKFFTLLSDILQTFPHVDFNEFELEPEQNNLSWKAKLILKLMSPHIVGVAKK